MQVDRHDELEHLETPLLAACLDERWEVAHQLIIVGADVDAPNFVEVSEGIPWAHTVLHVMANASNHSMVRLLLENGADVNKQATRGETALHYAALHDDVEMAEILLQAGADDSVVDFSSEARSPRDMAEPEVRAFLQEYAESAGR